jgi:glycosyltransferase involved in cell wall biosynthesis
LSVPPSRLPRSAAEYHAFVADWFADHRINWLDRTLGSFRTPAPDDAASGVRPCLAVLPYWDRFEDFYDKLGVSLANYRYLTGGWLFNYVDALHSAGIDTLIVYASAHVTRPVRFRHEKTAARIVVLPTPRLNHRIHKLREQLAPTSTALRVLATYAATPLSLVAREVRRQACGAILCQEYSYPRFDAAVLLGRLVGRPVFATYQGARHQLTPLERTVRRWSLRACAGLIVAASDERRYLTSHYALDDTKVAPIPNPIDVAEWEPEDRAIARRTLGLPADARIAVWHGRVEVHTKGLDVLLDAWARLKARAGNPRLRLLLVGTGRDAALLRDLIQPHEGLGVQWVDRYINDRAEVWRYLSAANVYVLPSRREGFALAPVEAMACGLPIVASDVSGVRDVLRDDAESAGIIVPAGDAAALAGALERGLLEPHLGPRLGARGRQRAREMYSPSVIGQRLRAFMTSRGAFQDRAR